MHDIERYLPIEQRKDYSLTQDNLDQAWSEAVAAIQERLNTEDEARVNQHFVPRPSDRCMSSLNYSAYESDGDTVIMVYLDTHDDSLEDIEAYRGTLTDDIQVALPMKLVNYIDGDRFREIMGR